MRILFYTLLLVFSFAQLFGQKINYKNYSDIKDYNNAIELTVNCYIDDFNDFAKNTDKFNNLKSLHITNYDNIYFPEDITRLNISKLIISNSLDLDYNSVFKLLSKIKTLKVLVLDNNEIIKIPKEIALIKSLTKIEITNNEGLDTERFINAVKSLESLRELSLALNLITNLPTNINELSQLKSLNISCNNLNDLPKEMKGIKGLDSLRMEDNIFANQVKSLNKLKNLELKFISLDKVVSEENREKLKKMFPKAKIEEIEIQLPLDDDNFIVESKVDTAQKETVKFGKITVSGKHFKAHSNAYFHYAKLFNNRRFDYTFDTLMFSERYLDTTYAMVMKIQDRASYNTLQFHKTKWFLSKKITFSLTRGNTRFFYNIFPELRAFNIGTWVYKGNLSKKEFKKEYIKDKEWIDIRIYYNEENKDFTIELKSKSGFTDIPVYYLISKRDLSFSQKRYGQLYSRYSKGLDIRKRKFHSNLLRNKNRYEKTRQNAINKTWRDFQRLYMSKKEKQMTKPEWLEYYDKVIANEKKALYSSTASIDVLCRSLDIEKYIYSNLNQLVNRNYTTISAGFFDKKGNKLPIKDFVVVDLKDRTYYRFRGSLGINLQSMFMANSNVTIIAELRNGNIGYITSNELSKNNIETGNEYSIKLNIIEKSLSSVGQLYKILGL